MNKTEKVVKAYFENYDNGLLLTDVMGIVKNDKHPEDVKNALAAGYILGRKSAQEDLQACADNENIIISMFLDYVNKTEGEIDRKPTRHEEAFLEAWGDKINGRMARLNFLFMGFLSALDYLGACGIPSLDPTEKE